MTDEESMKWRLMLRHGTMYIEALEACIEAEEESRIIENYDNQNTIDNLKNELLWF